MQVMSFIESICLTKKTVKLISENEGTWKNMYDGSVIGTATFKTPGFPSSAMIWNAESGKGVEIRKVF